MFSMLNPYFYYFLERIYSVLAHQHPGPTYNNGLLLFFTKHIF